MTDLLKTHPHFLFVYGTLKPTFSNNRLIMGHGGQDIGPALTVGGFLLNNNFPYVWKWKKPLKAFAPYVGQVVGHLYKVSDAGLEACDRLEGHPRHYCRTNISVTYGAGKFATAGIYLAPGEPSSERDLQRPIDGKLEWRRAEPAREIFAARRKKA